MALYEQIIKFDSSYARLPRHFFEFVNPIPVADPKVILVNEKLLNSLCINLNELTSDDIAKIFSGNIIIKGSKPIALAYAGHQFGHFVPQLGDGRAILLGEVIDVSGKKFEIQLKGSGQTHFSRSGDGRAPLGAVLREYILSEYMNTIKIPTTRSLVAVTTGEKILREKLLPGAILTRLATSHVRVGTFEYFAARNDIKAIKVLANYMINNYYIGASATKNPYQTLLELIVDAQASLIAQWLNIGFIHGVMNTDNTSIVGETLDYGPCAFMDHYDPNAVFSSIDYHGRYSYNNQAIIAQWNMMSLARCFIPILSTDINEATDIAQETISAFASSHHKYWFEGIRAKLGLEKSNLVDKVLVENFLNLMNKYTADFTLSFRYLSEATDLKFKANNLKELFHHSQDFNEWLTRWQIRIQEEKRSSIKIAENMNLINPLFIPRNHLVEEAIKSAEINNDLSKVENLIDILAKPYDDKFENNQYKLPPLPNERIYQTFCGT